MINILDNDKFTVTSLTESINNIPFVPGRAGLVVDWAEQGITTEHLVVEEYSGVLTLINPTPRGGPGNTTAKNKRKLRTLRVPHYQIDDAVYADEVQGVRAFGSETQLQTVEGLVNQRMFEHVNYEMDPTLEFQRLGALRGLIYNADLSLMYNLFLEFGVTPQADIDFHLGEDQEDGALRERVAQAARATARALGGLPYSSIYALCGDSFYDSLIKEREVRTTYLNQQEASQLRGAIGKPFSVFNFGEITFENYRGGTGNEEATPFIDPNECAIFPVGVRGLYRTVYAPADYEETVNTVGLPRYSKMIPRLDGKGRDMQLQTNALSFCTRPRVLIKGIAHSI